MQTTLLGIGPHGEPAAQLERELEVHVLEVPVPGVLLLQGPTATFLGDTRHADGLEVAVIDIDESVCQGGPLPCEPTDTNALGLRRETGTEIVNASGQESENGIVTEFAILESVTLIVAMTTGLDLHSTETDGRELHQEGRHLEDLAGAALTVPARDRQADGVLIDTSRIGESLHPESRESRAAPPRDAPRPVAYDSTPPTSRSPPRGPAALRAPPTGPAANRSFIVPVSSPAPPPLRSGTTSPTIPPAGPRGYVPPARGGFAPRGGRGGWSQPPSRHMSGLSPTPSTPNGPSTIPTGPRATPSNAPSSSTPTQARPFNPPTGPSAQHPGSARQTLAQSMLATLPPLIPGGKLDPSMTPSVLGVTREIEPHYRKLKDEEEKLRDELQAKQERLRKSLYNWDRLERDSRAWEMRSDLSEKSMKNMAGEGMGGAAF
ncbi:hypothetical protein G7Z17_g10468 [Cylindrodendrum hubeiense]|uniref:Uncharacterized protein n=1 Tax=Cylindrodendrum hubeiense TaxID=595255 RepID=A0A9P5LB68_9HYPO|nr:hypothetical protein G7Z17_g10468 [Cylindrodendrum hubeiense]